MKSKSNIVYSIPWNLFLITLGSVIVAVGIKAAIIPQGMITGGFSGLGLLCYYGSDILTPGIWYLILNIPVFIIGWMIARLRGSKTAFRVLKTFDSWIQRTAFKERMKHFLFRRVDAIETTGEDGKAYAMRYGVPSDQVRFSLNR